MAGVTEQLRAAPDTLLAGRYRLQKAVGKRGPTTTWRGMDEVLARPVAIKILDDPAGVRGGTAAFLDAAVAAGRLTHPRVASVFDAAEEGGLTYVVAEWVDGRTLGDALAADGPMSPARATTVAAQVAEAVAYAHSRGVFHLGLDAHNVLVCRDRSVKVTDFEVGAVGRKGARPDEDLPNELRDTRAIAALLYACLTGRSVTGSEPELAPAPYREGRLCAPRQVRAGVPRELDSVVVRTLLPELLKRSEPITTPAELVTALAPLPGEGHTSQRTIVPEDDVGPARPNRWLRLGVPLLAVAGVSVMSWLFGIALGTVPSRVSKLPGLGTESARPVESAAPGRPVAPKQVVDFDPLGDGEENANEVPLAYNGDATDAWHTTIYYNSPTFGNLKPGVGLLVDFGEPTTFDRVVVAFAEPGESLELRAANERAADPAAYQVVAAASNVKVPVTLRPQAGTRARYWLIWVTKLVETSKGKYGAAIAELGFIQ